MSTAEIESEDRHATIRVWSDTLRGIDRLCELDPRRPVSRPQELDWLIRDALQAKGIDPDTLQPLPSEGE